MNMQTQRRLFNHWIINRVVLPMAETSQVETRLRAILRSGGKRQAVSRRNALVALLMTTSVLLPIALLRSVPASAHYLTSPLAAPSPYNAVGKPAMPYDTFPVNPLWTRRISKSVDVELVGVTEGLGKSATSWQPDGMRLSQPLYRRLDQPMKVMVSGKDIISGKEKIREIAFRLTNPAHSAIGIECQILNNGGGLFEYQPGPLFKGDIPITDEREFSKETGGFRVLTAACPKSLNTLKVRIGVAAGSWHQVTSSSTEGNTTFVAPRADHSEDNVLFSSVIKSSAKSILTVSDTYVTQDYHVIAIGKNGQEYSLPQIGEQNGKKFRVTTYQFDIPLTQIKEFRFQTRPYKWVEFKNVALEPSGVSATASIQAKQDFIAAVHAHNQQVMKNWTTLALDASGVYQNPDGRQAPKITPHIFAPNYTLDGRHLDARQAASVLEAQARTYGLYRYSYKRFVGDMSAPSARVTIVTEGKKGSVIFSRLDVWIITPAGWRLTESQATKTVY